MKGVTSASAKAPTGPCWHPEFMADTPQRQRPASERSAQRNRRVVKICTAARRCSPAFEDRA
jgi:hypothetical protein